MPEYPRGLLVDDHKTQLLACQKLLRFWDIQTDFATTVDEAEVKAESQNYGFALLDYHMPGLSGGPRVLIQKLRAQSPACKIFIVTGYAHEARDNLADLNVPILEKPFDWEQFKNTLDTLVKQGARS